MVSPFLGIASVGSLLAEAEEPIDWIVRGMIPRGGVCFLVARPGAGKSLLAYHAAACVAGGGLFLGETPVTQGAAVYIDLDGRKSIAAMRAAAALRGVGVWEEDIPATPLYVAARQSSVDLRQSDTRYRAIEELRAVPNIALIVLDTWSDLHHGKEQSPDEMTEVARAVVEIATTCDCGVLVVHHQRKGMGTTELDDVRGAGSITAKADAVFLLTTERDEEGDPGALTLLQRKARLTEEARPRRFRIVSDGDVDGKLISYRYDPAEGAKMGRPATAKQHAERIAARLVKERPGMAKGELVQRLTAEGVAQTTAYRVAGDFSQKYHNPPPSLLLGNDESLPPQAFEALPPDDVEMTFGNAAEDLDMGE